MTAPLERYGFDAARTAFAGRTAVAACIAFIAGWALGLEHPQWSAMAVWAAAQPTRGQLLEKGFFRIAGTISGTLAGIALVLAMQIHPALLVLGLALWVGLCTAIGNLQRGFVAYGTVLAGYTAAMVSLLDAAHPDQVLHLGADRFATVLTGVVTAMVVGAVFAPPAARGALRARLAALVADLLEAAATPASDARAPALLAEMSAIEDGLDPHGAGSFRSRRDVRAVRSVLIAAMALLLWGRAAETLPAAVAVELLRAAQLLRADAPEAAAAALTRAAAGRPDLAETLAPLAAALHGWLRPETPPTETALPVVLHRDWIGAREAGLRAFGGLLLFGVIWQLTGWGAGAYMLLGLSVMLSLFSTFENPSAQMRNVFYGQILGVIGALACRWLAWPLAGSELQMILSTLPFILIGPLFVGHRRTVAASFDYNMVLMLMLQPHWPLSGSFEASLAAGLAVLAGPVAAMVAYRFVYPTSLRRRQDTLIAMMRRDLGDLAADPQALSHRQVWRARLYHRLLRLVRLSGRSARASGEAMEIGLALLGLGQATMRAHEIEASGTPAARAAGAVLARLARFPADPGHSSAALARLGARLSGADAMLFAEAATQITAPAVTGRAA